MAAQCVSNVTQAIKKLPQELIYHEVYHEVSKVKSLVVDVFFVMRLRIFNNLFKVNGKTVVVIGI